MTGKPVPRGRIGCAGQASSLWSAFPLSDSISYWAAQRVSFTHSTAQGPQTAEAHLIVCLHASEVVRCRTDERQDLDAHQKCTNSGDSLTSRVLSLNASFAHRHRDCHR